MLELELRYSGSIIIFKSADRRLLKLNNGENWNVRVNEKIKKGRNMNCFELYLKS